MVQRYVLVSIACRDPVDSHGFSTTLLPLLPDLLIFQVFNQIALC